MSTPEAPVGSRATRLRARSGARGSAAEFALRALALGFWVSLYGIVVALAFVAAAFLESGRTLGPVPGWAVSFWCAFTALFLVLAQLGRRSHRAAGRPLERAAAPELFALLDTVCEQMGMGPISAVRLKPAPLMAAARVRRPGRFAVTEKRALVIGLPLLRLLSPEQLSAAVAHELSHLAGGDVQRGRIVHSAWARIALMRTVLEHRRGPVRWMLTWANPVWWYLVVYGALLRHGAAVVRRRQEQRADGLAARAVGARVYAAALVRIACVGVAFRRLAPGIVVHASEQGRSIANFFADFAEALDRLSESARRSLVRDALATHGDGGDHPALAERLEDLGSAPPELPPEGGSCAALVPGLEAIERESTPLVLRGLMLGMGRAIRRRAARRGAAPGEGGATRA